MFQGHYEICVFVWCSFCLFLAIGFVFLLYTDFVCFFFEVYKNYLYNQNVCL